MFCMAVLGTGEMFGSQLMGFVIDKYSSKVAVILNIVLVTSMIIVTFNYLLIFEFSWLAFVMCFLWGA